MAGLSKVFMKSETQNLALQLAAATELTADPKTEPRTELIGGQQALVRLAQLQSARDRAAGLNTRGYVSGYRGSPLASVDKHFAAQAQALKAQGVVYEPGLNEDLAATAVWGTQQLDAFSERTVDGVFGLWYGKAPGLDRSIDAIRHANFWGTHPKGGVLAVVGDDPFSQSSSMANYSELALIAAGLPVLYPSSVQDLLQLGLLGWALSRHSGLWVGMKVVTDVAESFQSVTVAGLALPAELRSLASVASPAIATRSAREFERLMYQVRMPAVEEFLEVAQLNQRSIGNPFA